MKLLICDIIQNENKQWFTAYSSPQLFETHIFDTPIVFQFDESYTINCIGLGNCNSSKFTVSNNDGYLYTYNFTETDIVERNGLYIIPEFTTSFNPDNNKHEFIMTFDKGSKIGRIAAGTYTQLSTSDAKEIGFYTDKQELRSLSGAVLPTISGYAARRISLTVPYKIKPEVYLEFKKAYKQQLSNSFPLFIVFDDSEKAKFKPIGLKRFYGNFDNNFMFQSSVHKFLYSYNFDFTEAF